MGHRLFGDDERDNTKLNTKHLGKHNFIVLQNCIFIRCWEQVGNNYQEWLVAGLDIYQLTVYVCTCLFCFPAII